MSTLVILLCAAGFFATQTTYAISSEISDRDTVNRQIDQALQKISKRTAQIYRRVLGSGLQDAGQKFVVIQPYIKKAYQHLSIIENLVDNFISLEPEKHFNENECREYFYNYKEEFDDAVLSSIGRASDDVFQNSFLMIGEFLHAAHEKKRTLSGLRVQAKECNPFDCNDINKTVRNMLTNFLETADKTQNYYVKMANGSGIIKRLREQTDWDTNFGKGQEVLRKVFECVHYASRN